MTDTDARLDLLEQLTDDLLAANPRGRIIVAIDGVDGAGKTMFADAWRDVPVLQKPFQLSDLSAALARIGV